MIHRNNNKERSKRAREVGKDIERDAKQWGERLDHETSDWRQLLRQGSTPYERGVGPRESRHTERLGARRSELRTAKMRHFSSSAVVVPNPTENLLTRGWGRSRGGKHAHRRNRNGLSLSPCSLHFVSIFFHRAPTSRDQLYVVSSPTRVSTSMKGFVGIQVDFGLTRWRVPSTSWRDEASKKGMSPGSTPRKSEF